MELHERDPLRRIRRQLDHERHPRQRGRHRAGAIRLRCPDPDCDRTLLRIHPNGAVYDETISFETVPTSMSLAGGVTLHLHCRCGRHRPVRYRRLQQELDDAARNGRRTIVLGVDL